MPITAGLAVAKHPASQTSPSSVTRAMQILRVMSEGRNLRLTDIAKATGYDKTTVLRLLENLIHEGFVQRNTENKQFSLGPELTLLGAAALKRFDPRPSVRPSLLRLVGQFEDSVVLSIPMGLESSCIDLEEGSYPIRANYLRIGSRRPLGVGAGSLALLAWLPEDEREAAFEALAPTWAKYQGISVPLLKDCVASAHERGYAVLLDAVVQRMGGIAVPIFEPSGRPVAALSIAALSERISGREKELGQELIREALKCQVRWADASHLSEKAQKSSTAQRTPGGQR